MPRATSRLVQGRPAVEISLASPGSGSQALRVLLADTGAGSARAGMELLLNEAGGRRFSLGSAGTLRLGGAFTGRFPALWVAVSIPALGFSDLCLAVAVAPSRLPHPLEGIACYRFLNRFTYGNFGDADRFSLET